MSNNVRSYVARVMLCKWCCHRSLILPQMMLQAIIIHVYSMGQLAVVIMKFNYNIIIIPVHVQINQIAAFAKTRI